MDETQTKLTVGQEMIWAGLAVAFVSMVVGMLIGALVVAYEYGATWDATTIMVFSVATSGAVGFLLVGAAYLAALMLDW